MRIIVLGYIVRGPLGGLMAHRLGHDVAFIEESDDYESCRRLVHGAVTSDHRRVWRLLPALSTLSE